MSDHKGPDSSRCITEDDRLRELGYNPEFKRVLGLFADFSLGYSYMSPMAGIFALFATALVTAGPPFFWTMLVVMFGQILVCLVFAEAASAYPIAGGIYQWARRLGGQRYGFFTAWIYLCALIGTCAAVAAGGASFLPLLFGIEPTPAINAVSGISIAVIGIVANFVGTRVLARATEIGVWAGLIGLAVCGGYMLIFAQVQPISILWDNFGRGDGNYTQALFFSSLIGVWIFFGFEACGDLAEEVTDASKAVPRAMLMTIIGGGASALLMTMGVLLAVPDMQGAVNGTVTDPAGAAVIQALGPYGAKFTLLCLLAVAISATASVIASTSRLLFSMGRDNMIVSARSLGTLSAVRKIPGAALTVTSIFTIAILAVGFFSSNAATIIISFATTGIYLSFQLVVLASLIASFKGWRAEGSFKLGSAGYIIKIVALAFGIVSIANLMWPRTPEAGWFTNWLIAISLAVIVVLGLIQMLTLKMSAGQPTALGAART